MLGFALGFLFRQLLIEIAVDLKKKGWKDKKKKKGLNR
jgi:hypothetical protein